MWKITDENDIINKNIGSIVVNKFLYRKNKHIYYECCCKICNNKFIRTRANIFKRNGVPCRPCSMKLRKTNFIDLTGKRFGKLVVQKYIDNGKKGKWECQCDCGNKVLRLSCSLRKNPKNKRSCEECYVGKNHYNWGGYGEIPLHYFNSLKRGAISRNYEFKINIEYLWKLFQDQNGKCSLTGLAIHFNTSSRKSDGSASLDRIDSSKGYIEGNVQWVHKDINIMKWDLSQTRLIELCCLVSERMKNV